MGLVDTAKMIKKARDAQSQMKKITVAGQSKSGLTAVLINALQEVLEVQLDEELVKRADANELANEVKEAMNDARKQLEKELSSNMDLNSIRDMLSL